jgi:gamma-glutamyl hercynylcysteine S-oxide synthase
MPALYRDMVVHLPRERVRALLAAARAETDGLFGMLSPAALYKRPISERHRIVFYLGHLEVFDRNMICGTSFSELDGIFARGIDPVDGKLPDDKPGDWPSIETIRRYNKKTRLFVDEALDQATDTLMFHVAIEHRLMHAETLAYMFHWLPFEWKRRPLRYMATTAAVDIANAGRVVRIPAGVATLGLQREDPFVFGWDNEFQAHSVHVPEFGIDTFNVTNREFLEFVRAGGYGQRSFWDARGWDWINSSAIQHPKSWIERAGVWFYRTMFEEIPLPGEWPVYVSHAEAQAFARWKGKDLPTEAQYHRAAFGSPEGLERIFPWGEQGPGPQHGNFDFRWWTPAPVGSFPQGNSAFGIFDLMGNGWEWTSTPFGPFPGFEPFPFYPGYSADFFDGMHFVLKGASPRTAAALLRPSFRNWFQPLYPNIYATFRCVEN